MNEPKSRFIINILVKILYLFIFLSGLFYYIIQPMVTGGLRSMGKNSIKKNILSYTTDTVDSNLNLENIFNVENDEPIPSNENNIFRSNNRFIRSHLNLDKEKIRKTNENIPMEKYSTTTYNELLKSANILIIVFIALFILSIYISNRQDIPILKILGFNLILFCIIGTIEYMFFINVAAKYVPNKMSDIIELFKRLLLD